jgi:hypothetical protein
MRASRRMRLGLEKRFSANKKLCISCLTRMSNFSNSREEWALNTRPGKFSLICDNYFISEELFIDGFFLKSYLLMVFF